jgi:hypothetical protein
VSIDAASLDTTNNAADESLEGTLAVDATIGQDPGVERVDVFASEPTERDAANPRDDLTFDVASVAVPGAGSKADLLSR